MNFTFGIITNHSNINRTILSIEKLNIPIYEIIIVGGQYPETSIIKHIPFDESIKPNWITKKKNMICQIAKYDNIVLLHDYIEFCEDWYTGFLTFGNDFDICISKILNKNDTRFRDYTIFPYTNSHFTKRTLIPYDYPPSIKLSKILYISGSYYIIKKQIALQFQLDERLIWGDGEDVLLTKQLINNNIIIKCNSYSTIKFLKYKNPQSWENILTNEDIIQFESLSDNEIECMHQAQCNELKRHIFQNRNITLYI
jgi:hypothetical protein